MGLVREALTLVDTNSDPGSILALNAMLSQAYLHAGLLREGLAANDAAMAAVEAQSRPAGDGVPGFNVNAVYGFDVPQWIRSLRVRNLGLAWTL